MPRAKPAPVVKGSQVAVSWADVAGLDEAKEELQEVVEFLRDRKRSSGSARGSARNPAARPAGTGKTLLAKAVASASGANFYSQSASSFVEMFAGLGAARIRKLFEEARKNAPDRSSSTSSTRWARLARAAARPSRARSNSEPAPRRARRLLAQRDEVVVMAASNRLQDLDPALLPSGTVRPPGARLSARRLRPPVDPRRPHARQAARGRCRSRARGQADLRADGGGPREPVQRGGDLRRAKRCAVRSRQADFDAAMERIVGRLQQRRVVSEKEKRILAYHEAGHAVMSHLTGELFPVQKATIVSRRRRLSATRSTCPRKTATCTRARSSST